MLTALGLPEDMSSHVLALKVRPRLLFLRVAVTMISKRFVKLGILVYYKYSSRYEVKMTLISKFIVYPYFEKSLLNKWLKSKIFQNFL